MSILPLFSTPIYYADINIDLIHLDKKLNEIEYQKYDKASGSGSVCQKILLDRYFSKVRKEIERHLNTFLYEELSFDQGKIKHLCSWINLHEPGEASHDHIHANSLFSGVLYLDIPDSDSGDLILVHSDELPSFKTSTIDVQMKNYNLYNSKTWRFKPRNNLLIIFPSHLRHKTDPNLSNKNRYSLAFNYFLEGRLGKSMTNQIII